MGSHDPFPIPMVFTQWLGALPGQRREAEAGAGQVGPWVYRNMSAVQWQWMGPFPKLFFILFFVLQLFAILVAKKQSKAASFFLSHHLKIWSRSSGKQRPRRKLPVEMDSSSTPQDVCPAP